MTTDHPTRPFPHGPLRVVARAVSGIEGLLWGNSGPTQPPLFIVGLPRGGTTLIYQCICWSMEAAYPTELTNRLPVCPALATSLARGVRRHRADYRSHYGRSTTMAAPGEGVMWNLWLDKHRWYDSAEELTATEQRELRRLVGRIERQRDRPFVNKNLRHNQRVRLLAELFPDALFLMVERSPMSVAVSLLRGRLETRGIDAWFSIKPRDHAVLAELPPEQAVAGQVAHLLRDLQQDLRAVGVDRCRVLGYEEFCAAPLRALQALQAWVSAHGSRLAVRHPPPESFRVSQRTEGVDARQVRALQTHLATVALPELQPRLLPETSP